jgi:hypothetical protein
LQFVLEHNLAFLYSSLRRNGKQIRRHRIQLSLPSADDGVRVHGRPLQNNQVGNQAFIRLAAGYSRVQLFSSVASLMQGG